MYKKKYLRKTFKKIRKIYPKANNIDINVKTLPDGTFSTNLEVKTSNKNLFASKIDNSYVKSVEKSYDAIVKQIEKIKRKNVKRVKSSLN